MVAASFQGTPLGVRDALSSLRAEFELADVGNEETHSAELVVAEVLNNVVEHALKDATDPMFHLAMDQGDDGINVVIRDRGHPMPDNTLPEGNLPDIDTPLAELPEGGFGWFMIRQLTRDLTYSRCAGENRLSFRLNIF